MIYDSIFISFLLRLFNIAKQSKLFAAAHMLSTAFSECFAARAFRRFTESPRIEERYAHTSVFYGVINGVWGGIISLLRFVMRPFLGAAQGSTLVRLAKTSAVFNFENILFGFILIIFIIPHGYWNNMYALAGTLVVAGLYALSLARGKKLGQNARGLWLSMLMFAVAVVLAVFVSDRAGDSLRVSVFFITSFLLCAAVYGTLTDLKKFHKLTFFLFLTVIITSLIGIVQNIVGVLPDASLTDLSLNSDMPGRVYSTLDNPNNFAEFLVLFLPFCGAFVLNLKNKYKKTMGIALLILPVLALMYTYSRSGFLAFAASAVVFFVMYKPKAFPILVLGAILMVPFLPESVMSRIMTIGNLRDSSSAYRIDIWTAVLLMMKNIWVTGTGLGPEAFKSIYPVYAEGLAAVAPHSHMLFMEVFVEMGILGIVTFFWLVINLVKGSVSAASQKLSDDVRIYGCAAAASAFGIMVLGFAEYIWFYPRVMFAFFIAVGMGMAAVKLAGRNTEG